MTRPAGWRNSNGSRGRPRATRVGGNSTGMRRMSGGSFLDSNVLVYTDDGGNPPKQAVAVALVGEAMRSKAGVISLQVLQEYFSVATRKLGVDAVTAREKVEL